jgi:hypothetical protein
MERVRALVVAGSLIAAVLLAGAVAATGQSIQVSRNGNTITITGFTNLAPGDRLLVNVVSAGFTPTEKGNGTGFSGAAGTVVVQPGAPLNSYHFDVDVSSFSPGMYLVSVESVETGFRDQGQFILPWTPVPTVMTTPAATVSSPASTLPPAQTSTQAPQASPTRSPIPLAIPACAALVAAIILRRRL